MNQDWMKRTSWSQPSTVGPQSDTTGYKTHGEDIELPVRRNQALKTDLSESTLTEEPVVETRNGYASPPPPRGKITKSFKLATKPFGFNITITETTRYEPAPVYFAVSSEFKKQPDIVLHAGQDKNGNRVAVAFFRFSRHIRMGFGPEALTSGEGMWEDMKNTSTYWGHWRYEFEYAVPPSDHQQVWDVGPDAGRMRRRFMWERTRDEVDGVKGVIEQHLGWRNYRLVDQGSGQVLAVMLVSMFTGCSYKGVLNLHEELSKEMEQLAVLTAICIFDKGERRTRHYAFGGASGGP